MSTMGDVGALLDDSDASTSAPEEASMELLESEGLVKMDHEGGHEFVDVDV